jgi:hypothetical protein
MEMLAQVLNQWDAGPIEAHPASPKLKTRVIAGTTFQFKVQDYRTRTRMALRVISQAEKLQDLITKGLTASKLADDEKKLIFAEVIPTVLKRLNEADFIDTIDHLNFFASADIGNGKFEDLALDHVGEAVFSADLTLQIPVAISVAEVNLTDFFARIAGALGLTA